MNNQSIEQEIQAERKETRITPADIEANIVSEFYFTAADGVRGSTPPGLRTYVPPGGLKFVTFCVLILRNGTRIVGVNYGAIDPDQHNPVRGKVEARGHAVEQIWPLMGYELRTRLQG